MRDADNLSENYRQRSSGKTVLDRDEPSGRVNAPKAYVVIRKFAEEHRIPCGKVLAAYDEAMILNEVFYE